MLAETLAGFQNVEIVNADVMKVDLRALIAEKLGGLRVVVCANLPYYITSPIVMGLLEQRLPIESVTVMVQKEAAQRLCALPGTREAGAVSCAVRYYSEPKVLFPVSRGSFLPSPDVDSAVIRLDIRREPPVDPGDEKTFFRVVRAAFSMRRKTLLNCLSAACRFPRSAPRPCSSGRGCPRGHAPSSSRWNSSPPSAARWRRSRNQKRGAGGAPFLDCLVGHAVFDDMGGQPVNAAACSEVQPLRRHSSTVSPSSSRYPAKRSASRS